MTPQDALIELLARVGARNGAVVLVSAEELNQWPAAAVAAMKSQKLLARARPAVSVVCPGCERECVMPVHTVRAGPRGPASFIVCDKRDDINRVSVSADRLMQWRCDADAVCGFIAASLGLRRSDQHPADAGLLNIGMASGDKRSQMLSRRFYGDCPSSPPTMRCHWRSWSAATRHCASIDRVPAKNVGIVVGISGFLFNLSTWYLV